VELVKDHRLGQAPTLPANIKLGCNSW